MYVCKTWLLVQLGTHIVSMMNYMCKYPCELNALLIVCFIGFSDFTCSTSNIVVAALSYRKFFITS